ncbi:MAG TPA: hypothetical protein VLG11_01930 [Candidatus Saccharimonadales bacterium]|nr:hypothetical protein [Candidatus Saccharimonadales bacterium]
MKGIDVSGEAQDRFYEAVAALKQVEPELIVLAGARAEDDGYSSRLALADHFFAATALGVYMNSNPAATLITHWNQSDAEGVNVHVDPAHAQLQW